MSIDEVVMQGDQVDISRLSDEGRVRMPPGMLGWVVFLVGVGWSFFHFYTLGFGLLTSTLQRSAHLAVGLALCFLYFPQNRKKTKDFDSIAWYDLLLALLGFISVFYVFYFYRDLAGRVGAPITMDLWMGGIAVVLVLVAAYRAFGLALPMVALVFLIYPFVGQYLPHLIGHRGYRITRVINELYITNSGIFGIPVGVSSTFVFAFVLFGSFFQVSGAATYIVKIAFSLLGRFRGGPAKAAVLASGFMGSIAGSSVANTVVTGSITIPTMKNTGFEAHIAGGVETAASTNGQFLPPVMGAAAFIMAEFTGIPYWQIATAAVLPAVISYAGLLGMVHLQAAKTGMKPMLKHQIPPFVSTFLRGIFYWIPIGVLIYYLLIVRLTPFTAGYIAILTVLAIIVAKRVVLLAVDIKHGRVTLLRGLAQQARGLWDDFVGGLDASAKSMCGIAVACACAGIIVGVVTLTGLGMTVTLLFSVVAQDSLLILLLGSALLSIILGLGLPTTAKYAVMATLVAPAILAVEPGLPVVAVHLFILYYAILADDTPPVGVAAYAAAAIARSDPIRTGLIGFKFDLGAFFLPFMFVYNTQFLLIDTTWHEALLIGVTSLFGIYCLSAVIQRWLLTRLALWEMAVLLAIAVAMVWPSLITDVISAVAFVAIYLNQRRVAARNPGLTVGASSGGDPPAGVPPQPVIQPAPNLPVPE
ncbi:MAG: TRAP transporter permease [Spirochaetaceae bacterium]|nr:MAG: TRAP transporter permease [Spirochaetaceae bacterium]